jgi:hypothetical protein
MQVKIRLCVDSDGNYRAAEVIQPGWEMAPSDDELRSYLPDGDSPSGQGRAVAFYDLLADVALPIPAPPVPAIVTGSAIAA